MSESGYCIDPEFNLYKCLYDVNDKNNSIGILDSENKIKLFNLNNKQRIRHFNFITNPSIVEKKCNNCSWLPICRGECPLHLKDYSCKEEMNQRMISYIKYKIKPKSLSYEN